MKIIDGVLTGRIPQRLVDLSFKISKRKDFRNNLLKTYSIILFKQKKEVERNKKRNRPQPEEQLFVSISSSYFTKVISKRYYSYLKILKENHFVRVKGRELDNFESKTGLFNETQYVESYKVGEYSKSYKITEKPIKSDPIFKFELDFELNPIYLKNLNFLLSVEVEEPKITTDNYGFRIYHNLSTNYKEYFPTKGKFLYYDFKSSIPFHLRRYMEVSMNSEGISQDPFLELFKGDFYENWNVELNLNLSDRKKIKKNFSSLIYGNKVNFSPVTLKLIKYKFPFFFNLLNKNLGKKITRMETEFVLNDVVSKLDLERVLTIHDGFIIHFEDQTLIEKQISKMDFQSLGFTLKSSFI